MRVRLIILLLGISIGLSMRLLFPPADAASSNQETERVPTVVNDQGPRVEVQRKDAKDEQAAE